MVYNLEMEKLIRNFVPVNDVQCDGNCRFFDGTTPLFRDTHHLSAHGSILLVKDVAFPHNQ